VNEGIFEIAFLL